MAHNPVHHDRTKHVEVNKFFIKEKLDEKFIELPKIRSDEQIANILTKVVSNRVFSKFVNKLGMNNIYTPTWGKVLKYSLYSYVDNLFVMF